MNEENNVMKIKIKDLVQIIDVLAKKLNKEPNYHIDLGNKDYFWEIAEEELYNPLQDPNPENISLGQISDDWKELIRLRNKNAIPITHDLKRLGNILICVANNSEDKVALLLAST